MTPNQNPDTNSLEEQLSWLFAQQRFLNPTLERTKTLLAFLGDPQQQFETVLVGGTNGKGSVVVSIAAMLQADGKRTARFISPHLSYFAERFVVDGKSVSDQALLEVLIPLRTEATRIGASFFEIVTAMACKLFAEAQVDVAVFEVGLGGRFDSTNCLDPVVSIITNVSLDHTKVLGDTVEEIAADKAQIMRAGKPCFSAATSGALQVLQTEAKAIDATFTALEDVLYSGKSLAWQGVEIAFEADKTIGLDTTLTVQSKLLGQHQIDNISLAVLAAKALGASDIAVQKGAETARWSGRLEAVVHKEQHFLLDGAHNQASAKALSKAIKDLGLEKPMLVFGISGDKNIQEVVTELESAVGEVILCKAANSPRAALPEDLVDIWSEFKDQESLSVAESLESAIDQAVKHAARKPKRKTKPKQAVVIAGSLYLIGEIRPLLLAETTESWERWQ